MGRRSDFDIRPRPKVWPSSPNEYRTSAQPSKNSIESQDILHTHAEQRHNEPQHRQSSPREHPQNSAGIGVGSLFSAENLQYVWNAAREDQGYYW